MGRYAALITIGVLTGLVGCETKRPQALVNVTTDLALPSQLATDATLSAAATIDRVRAETLDETGAVYDSHEFLFTERFLVPVSFGVPAAADGSVRVRITGFRSASSIIAPEGETPLPGVSIERLLITNVSDDHKVDVVLHGACFGAPSSFANQTTCIDAARQSAPATDLADNIQIDYASSPLAKETPCPSDAPSGMICIPGGSSAIGDPSLVTVDPTSDLIASSPREVMLSPFFLDENEMTVAQLRALFSSGKLKGEVPTLDTVEGGCNYSNASSITDSDGVRCVSFATARAACRARGGDLPTAAQWEYAARGRGLITTYPWGNEPPTCCTAAIAGGQLGCTPPNLTVGSHASTKSCATADVSPDGVRDLAGSVREWVIDAATDLSPCFAPGVSADPVCAPTGAPLGTTKGGSYTTSLASAASALRRKPSATTYDIGFRCVR